MAEIVSPAMMKTMQRLTDRIKKGEVDLSPLIKRIMSPESIEGIAVAFVDELRGILNPGVKKKLADDISFLKGSKFYLGFLDIDEPPIVIELIGLPNLIRAMPSTEEEVEEQKLPGVEMDFIAMMDVAMPMMSGADVDMIKIIEEDKMNGVRLGRLIPLFSPMVAMMSLTSLDTLQQRVMPKLMNKLIPMMMGAGG
jgi:hypothetical protein